MSVATDQLSVGRQSGEEVQQFDVLDCVRTSKFGGKLDQTPDEDDVTQRNHVEDAGCEREHDDSQPRQPRHLPRGETVSNTDIQT